MKKRLLLSLFITGALAGHSQYIPFPDSGAVWVNNVTYWEWGEEMMEPVSSEYDNFCVNGEDTLIGSYTYTKVNHCGGLYHGALRDNGGQVYYVPADSTQEYLLYDFTATVGTILQNVYIDYGLINDLEVFNVTTEYIGGINRKVLYMGGAQWIEGLGCTQGLFHVPWGNVSGWTEELVCMHHDDSTRYPDLTAGSCALDLSADNNDDVNELEIYPNPTGDHITIVTGNSERPATIGISNASGKQLQLFSEQNGNQITADLSSLPPGLYFITILTEQGEISAKIVKQ